MLICVWVKSIHVWVVELAALRGRNADRQADSISVLYNIYKYIGTGCK